MNDIRENIKNIIEDRGLIKTVIAKKINLTPAKLSAVLHKNRKMEATEFLKLCKVLEISPEQVETYKERNYDI